MYEKIPFIIAALWLFVFFSILGGISKMDPHSLVLGALAGTAFLFLLPAAIRAYTMPPPTAGD